MARTFPSSPQFLSADDSPSLRPVAPMAVGLWCKANSSPGNFKYLISKVAQSGDHASYAFATDSTGALRFTIGYNNVNAGFTNSVTIPAATIWDGQWHYVIGTFDGSVLKNFFDGVQQGGIAPTPNGNIFYNTSPVYLGTFDGTQLFYGGGYLAEVAIWNSIPDDFEIRALAKGASPLLIRPKDLAAYWPLTGRDTTEADLVRGNTMTNSGSTFADHPRTFRRTRSLWVPPPSAVAPPPVSHGGIWGVPR